MVPKKRSDRYFRNESERSRGRSAHGIPHTSKPSG